MKFNNYFLFTIDTISKLVGLKISEVHKFIESLRKDHLNVNEYNK